MENPRGPTASSENLNLILERPSAIQDFVENLKLTFAKTDLPKETNDPVVLARKKRTAQAFKSSFLIHMLMLLAVVVPYQLFMRHEAKIKKAETVIAIDISNYNIVTKPDNKLMGGGGGGGDRDKLAASKGKLPKLAMEQFTPPAAVISNPDPKLPVEPTVVIPPNVQIPQTNLPNFGDPMANVGPPSNGTGSGGGIGSGSGGGVGSGEGPGVGPGRGGGIGGGIFRVGGGVSAPVCTSTANCPDPEYSEEGRKAKYEGTVVLFLIVTADGRTRDIQIQRSLGMGLDQKAIEAVRKWRFQPAMRNGQPVAVQINVEVKFSLY